MSGSSNRGAYVGYLLTVNNLKADMTKVGVTRSMVVPTFLQELIKEVLHHVQLTFQIGWPDSGMELFLPVYPYLNLRCRSAASDVVCKMWFCIKYKAKTHSKDKFANLTSETVKVGGLRHFQVWKLAFCDLIIIHIFAKETLKAQFSKNEPVMKWLD